MSAIWGIVRYDGPPVEPFELHAMGAVLRPRTPDGASIWHADHAGLGHGRLATRPESLSERQPCVDAASGCVLVADARLDNRDEILSALRLPTPPAATGDDALLLHAYLRWGEDCATHLLGDFAFAVWDPRTRTLFCARDPFGMRPFYFHHQPGRLFAFASEPRAVLTLPAVPYRINEGRIADFLVDTLEGIDKTCTFFLDVERLPPAHRLTVTPQGPRLCRFWRPEPADALHLSSDEAYAEAFLDVFGRAVKSRLRGAPHVGSMLSGGMDSGSIVAIAAELTAACGIAPLHTFSAIAPAGVDCVETRSIQLSCTRPDLASHTLHYAEIERVQPELDRLNWALDDPFDQHMTLPQSLYLLARQAGMRVLLDGAGGDLTFGEGNVLARLLRAGHWADAYREAVARNHFWGCGRHPVRELFQSGRAAFVPIPVRRLYQLLRREGRPRARYEAVLRSSCIAPDFARRADLAGRLLRMRGPELAALPPTHAEERALVMDQAYLSAARERYGRAAAGAGVEACDPFLDTRVVAFALALPARQKLSQGWPKVILRRAMAGRMPDEVRWRRGKEHLGWPFTRALLLPQRARIDACIEAGRGDIAAYIDPKKLEQAGPDAAGADADDSRQLWPLFTAAHLATWLQRHRTRPPSRPSGLETHAKQD